MDVSPAVCRSLSLAVFDHKLNIREGTGNEGLRSAKDFVVFLGRGVTVMQSRDYCADWEREASSRGRL